MVECGMAGKKKLNPQPKRGTTKPRLTPTLKQKAFADNLLKSNNITESAVTVYNVKNRVNAGRLGHHNLQQPAVINYIKVKLNKAGLSEDKISTYLNKIAVKGVKGEPSVADAIKVLDMALKLHGSYPAKQTEVKKLTATLQLDNKSPEQLAKMLSQLTSDATNFVKLTSKTIKTATK